MPNGCPAFENSCIVSGENAYRHAARGIAAAE
jgi:hypothetical protein